MQSMKSLSRKQSSDCKPLETYDKDRNTEVLGSKAFKVSQESDKRGTQMLV